MMKQQARLIQEKKALEAELEQLRVDRKVLLDQLLLKSDNENDEITQTVDAVQLKSDRSNRSEEKSIGTDSINYPSLLSKQEDPKSSVASEIAVQTDHRAVRKTFRDQPTDFHKTMQKLELLNQFSDALLELL